MALGAPLDFRVVKNPQELFPLDGGIPLVEVRTKPSEFSLLAKPFAQRPDASDPLATVHLFEAGLSILCFYEPRWELRPQNLRAASS